MDYKELIGRLNAYSAKHQRHGGITAEAADAIETLLAERDAAVEELHGRCSKCKHFHSGPLKFPCADCCLEGGTSDHWEWRGPMNGAE